MSINSNNWFDPVTKQCSQKTNAFENKSLSTIDEGRVIRIHREIKSSHQGNFTNFIIENNGVEEVVLCDLGDGSDFDYESFLLLKGKYIKPSKRPGPNNELYTKSFNDLPDINERNLLRSVKEKNHEFSKSFNDDFEDLNKEPLTQENTFNDYEDPADAEAKFLNENFSKADLIVIMRWLRLPVFLSREQ
tara:strand:- start:523 stop:1092 length:570 start_codon:yes stop_codon:yes gene_type:complete